MQYITLSINVFPKHKIHAHCFQYTTILQVLGNICYKPDVTYKDRQSAFYNQLCLGQSEYLVHLMSLHGHAVMLQTSQDILLLCGHQDSRWH